LHHFFHADLLTVRTQPDREYPDSPAFLQAVEQREKRYPLQYLIGEWYFYRQTYRVTPDCLIPRPDTERLVEEAIRLLPPNAFFADLCAGSGCIAVSILAERPDTHAVAVDKFPATLALAVENAHRNGVADRLIPLCADVLAPDFAPSEHPLDAILSNPPYIPSAVIPTLEPELFAEPVAALDGGEDGLIFYRTLLQTQAKRLTTGGFFLFEIGFDQGDALRRYGEKFGFSQCRILQDYGGNDRVVHLSAPTA
jgi:release factor glutamine methyltransferase